MANYEPPTEDLPIFDNSVFVSKDTPVTIEYANKHYLKYPNAQGTENLLAINVAGLASMLSGVDIADGTNKTNIDQSGENIVIDNNVNNGTLIYKTNNNSGVETTVLTVNPTNGITLNNVGITQQGTNINNITNNLRQTTIKKTGTGAILNIEYDSSEGGNRNNNGLTLTNTGIFQTGSQATSITNSLGSTKLINGSGLTLDWGSTLFINANAGAASANYRMGTQSGLNLKLNYYTSSTGVTTELVSFNETSSIAITPPITNSSTMPASSDSSTRVPTTAWVQGAITANAGGSNLTKNSYTVSPTSSILGYTSGIFNTYNTGATIGYVSRESTYINSSVGYLTNNPLIISIVNNTGAPPNSPVVGNQVPTFSPLTNPVKISIDVFMYNNSGSSGYLRTKLMLLPSCCFSVSNQGWTGWGKYDISTQTNGPNYYQNYAYALDNRINGNSAFTNNDATYCPYKVSGHVPTPPSPALVASPSFTGRQCWSYDTSISSGLGISVLGMTYGLYGTNNIYVWFSGFTADNTTVFNVNAKIEDSSGANVMNNGIASSVSLSYLIPPP